MFRTVMIGAFYGREGRAGQDGFMDTRGQILGLRAVLSSERAAPYSVFQMRRHCARSKIASKRENKRKFINRMGHVHVLIRQSFPSILRDRFNGSPHIGAAKNIA